jgi:BirA family biotin operon repressor/biotin-[acetyl-CoA-carboxylase] ligase
VRGTLVRLNVGSPQMSLRAGWAVFRMRCFHFDTTDSTNLQARGLAAVYPGQPLLVTAAEQSAGRGRQGRRWQSPRGGAWMSVAWPLRRPPAAYGAASLAAAVAVRRALCDVTPELAAELRIKWPNDVLVGDRKVAGILCELTPASSGDVSSPGVLIIGVGVNVDFHLTLLAANLRHPATTLAAAAGRAIAVDAVVDGVANRLAEAMAQFESVGLSEALLNELRANLAYIGTVRTHVVGDGTVTGRVRGIDDFGRLVLETATGAIACDTGELLAEQR